MAQTIARRFRRRVKSLKGKLDCQKCPIPRKRCQGIANLLWGENRCLLRVLLGEVLIVHADRRDREAELKKLLEAAKQ